MTYQDPNSGAVPQPGGYAYKPQVEGEEKSAIEDTEAEAQKAIAGEAPYDNARAGMTSAEDVDKAAKEGDSQKEDKAPAKSAAKGEWVDYAEKKGANREEAEGMTKEELVEKYGD